MLKILYIGIGGAIGAILRYGMSVSIDRHLKSIFPFGILFVNLTGALLIGFIFGASIKYQFSEDNKFFLITGLLGGFTTFSTFALDSFNLLQIGKTDLFFYNILFNNVLAILFVYIGFYIAKIIIR